MGIDRRQLIIGGMATPLAAATVPAARVFAGDPVFIGDMHYHLFFFGRNPASKQPLRQAMARGNATLVSWSLVGDVPWLRPAKGGFRQKGVPKNSKESMDWFKAELARIRKHLDQQDLKIVRTADDVDRAVKGEPHVVLSVEGATMVDGDLAPLTYAYEQGIRHIQLVHYIDNPIGDFQTRPPRYDGLTPFGRDVILECNRLGILVDLAHCSQEAVMQALSISTAPMVWSHSSVAGAKAPGKGSIWQARRLPMEAAKALASQGGVVGLWALSADVGNSVEAYAEKMLELAGWIGEDNVAFGTDLNALANPAIKSYADLQRVVSLWRKRGISEVWVQKLAIGNYARVLQQAFSGRSA